jgi:hypothetical protein
MTTEEIFLVDSSSFMAPYRFYYAFDLVPAYWNAIIEFIKSGRIVVLDMVEAEIDKGEDDLSRWMSEVDSLEVIPHVNESTIGKYQEIIQFIATSGFYKESALNTWAQRNVADPWLIASAATNGYTLVTEEVGTNNLSIKQPQKAAKIPDVAGKFKVETINIYEMMRRLGIVIK